MDFSTFDLEKLQSVSYAVKPGDTFVAIRGEINDGHDYIDTAIENGAVRIVCERGDYPVETVIVENTVEWIEKLLEYYSVIPDDMKYIGVTGTNGKTTTTYFTSQILTFLGVNNAYIGSPGFLYNSKWMWDTRATTPDRLSLRREIAKAHRMGAEIIVLELSSHGLYSEKAKGINLEAAAFTNLTPDHLEFHLTMEEYCKAKMKIKDKLTKNGTMIINRDDPVWESFITDKYETVSLESGDYTVKQYKFSSDGTDFILQYKGKDYPVKVNFTEKHNLTNFMSALALVHSLGYSIEEIISHSQELVLPAGRNQMINAGNKKTVIDYACTPDAMEKTLSYYTNEYMDSFEEPQQKPKRIITVFGCGGHRYRGKRAVMGSIAEKYSDYIIVTTDNPRNEIPEEIISEITAGIHGSHYEAITDRTKAIRRAIEMMNDNDLVIIFGMGADKYKIPGTNELTTDYEQILLNINK